ncbi:PDDEXK nuclease domain-containing protein [Rhodococcus sp. NPDC003382]
MTTRLHDRQGAAPSNFGAALEQRDSELAQQLTRDPFTLEFLAIDSDSGERELEERLVARIIDTLRELGRGFAFVGAFDVDRGRLPHRSAVLPRRAASLRGHRAQDDEVRSP